MPPESIWVFVHSTSSNLKVNDEGAKIFADDSTDNGGLARVTIPSFSGNGTISVGVTVSGKFEGYKSSIVRTTDTNADSRSDGADMNCSRCWSDINYDGHVDGADSLIILQHTNAKHWHRNTLFGTPVRRTNMCPTCPPYTPNTLGFSFSWAPHGKMLSASIFNAQSDCAIYLLPTDPSVGNGPIPFSHPDLGFHDYDSNWSPLGDIIAWDRADSLLFTKGVSGHDVDTTEHQVPVVTNLTRLNDISLSPDGNTIAFAGAVNGLPPSIYTVPVGGGAPSRLTYGASVDDDYPQWSPDGKLVVFYRGSLTGSHLFETLAADTTGASVRELSPSDTTRFPVFQADGKVIVIEHGGFHRIATLDTTASLNPGVVDNYPEYTGGGALPKTSPDGTRLALRAKPPGAPSENDQIWVVRRNMSLPPQFSAFGGQSLADSTALVPVSVLEGLNYTAASTASDPEADPLTYSAYFLQQGMTFSPSTQTFSWTPPSGT
ncbi:MAG: hypothetical protein ACRDL7_02665, partial [Gaiellaceae bacterium]